MPSAPSVAWIQRMSWFAESIIAKNGSQNTALHSQNNRHSRRTACGNFAVTNNITFSQLPRRVR